MKKPKCNAVFNPLSKEGARHEISAALGVLVGGINARRPAAPKTERRSTTQAAGVSRSGSPTAQSFARRAGPCAHKLRRGVKFILWIAARNDRISVANVT